MPQPLTVVLAGSSGRRGTGGRIAGWLAEQWPGPLRVDDSGGSSVNGPVVLVVPSTVRPGELERLVAPLHGARVAVIAYGGVDRGAAVLRDVLGALDDADVEGSPFAVALNAALVRVGRFSEFDVISARTLMSSLQPCEALGERDGRS